jgi:hypothetical protein
LWQQSGLFWFVYLRSFGFLLSCGFSRVYCDIWDLSTLNPWWSGATFFGHWRRIGLDELAQNHMLVYHPMSLLLFLVFILLSLFLNSLPDIARLRGWEVVFWEYLIGVT